MGIYNFPLFYRGSLPPPRFTYFLPFLNMRHGLSSRNTQREDISNPFTKVSTTVDSPNLETSGIRWKIVIVLIISFECSLSNFYESVEIRILKVNLFCNTVTSYWGYPVWEWKLKNSRLYFDLFWRKIPKRNKS